MFRNEVSFLQRAIGRVKFEVWERIERKRRDREGLVLLREILAILVPLSGETGKSEGAVDILKRLLATRKIADEQLLWSRKQIDKMCAESYEIMTTLASALGLTELPSSTSGSDGLVPAVTLAQQAAAEIKLRGRQSAPEYAGKPLDCGLCDGKYDHADNCPGIDGASHEVHQCPNPNALCPDPKAGQ